MSHFFRLAPLLVALLFAACECDTPSLRPTLPANAVIDSFSQAQVSRLDILWIIDNSNSMVEEQQNLADNLNSFFSVIDEGDVDYQIAVTTTDAVANGGRFVGDPQILTSATTNVLDLFRVNIQVGIGGRAQEQGFEAAMLALTTENPDYLRPSAFLFVIFVSDEDDSSFGEVRYFWRTFEQLKGIGNDQMVSVSAIIGPPNDENGEGGGCDSDNGTASAGDRYADLADQTGGFWGSICDASFADTLGELAAKAVGLKRKFFLTETPDPDKIEVRLHFSCDDAPYTQERIGIGCGNLETGVGIGDFCDEPEDQDFFCEPRKGGENGWSYDPVENSIFFAGDSVPALKSRIEIIYLKPDQAVVK